MENLNNANISGSGTISGGEYGKISISGSGRCTSNVKALEIHVSGSGKFEGNVECNSGRANGSMKCLGSMKFESFTANGSFHVEGDISGTKLQVNGVIKCEKEINVEEFIANVGGCQLSEIHGDKIEFISKHNLSTINQVEATDIKLVNVKAERVSGQRVVIGRTCSIGLLEYGESLTIGKDAKIDRIIKI